MTTAVMASPRFLTMQQAAMVLSVSPRTVARWIKCGTIAIAATPGRTVRIPTAELARLAGEDTDDFSVLTLIPPSDPQFQPFDAAGWPQNAEEDQARRLIAEHGLARYEGWCNEADAAIEALS